MGSFVVRFMHCFVDHRLLRCTKNSEEPIDNWKEKKWPSLKRGR
jgi:hypothetical protein